MEKFIIIINIFFYLTSCGNSTPANPEGISNQTLASVGNMLSSSNDPFIGKFTGQLSGNNLVLEIKKVSGSNYHLFLNGLGPDYAQLNGNLLTGVSAGLSFTIKEDPDGIILNIKNQDVKLVREGRNSNSAQQIAENTSRTIQTSADPFEGSFSGYIDNNPITIKLDKVNQNEYSFYFNGQGPMTVNKTGNLIQLSEAGMVFTLESNSNGLVLKGNGREINLSRSGSSVSSNSQGSTTQENDPFSGQFDVVFQGQIRESWNIKKINSNQYQLSSPKGNTMGTRNGNKLTGFDDVAKIGYEIEFKDGQLTMQAAGYVFNLNKKSSYQSNTNSAGNIDPRLIGLWVGSSSYTSRGGVGTASISRGYRYLFKQDGTYQTISESGGGGDYWSGTSSGGVETGNFQVSSINSDGGFINLNGTQLEYTFFDSGNKMKMGSIIYSRRRID